MCGIIGLLGKTDVQDRIVGDLSCLEYRGYDSASVAIMSDAKVICFPSSGNRDDFLFHSLSKRDQCRSAAVCVARPVNVE